MRLVKHRFVTVTGALFGVGLALGLLTDITD